MKRFVGVFIVATLVMASPAWAAPSAGSPGLGDRFFPQSGNGGYHVVDYHLEMSWEPSTTTLKATAEITATATQELDRFNLDLRGFTVQSVEVNGEGARFSRDGQELTIHPRKRVRNGATMRVDVKYRGTPETITDPDGSPDGWIYTDNGIAALSEPQGSPSWFPSNDYPSEKSTFEIEVTVPSDLVAISNGLPDRPKKKGNRTTYSWHESKPMAPYLATLAIGHYTVTTYKTASGLPVINAVQPGMETASAPSLNRIPEMVDWLASIYGPYPFESVGAIVTDAPNIGYALETQTRPTYTFVPDDSTVVHELAHQWVGDSVSLATWPDMWLNEGFAGYTEWLWAAHDGGATADATFDATMLQHPAGDAYWTQPIGPTTLPDASVLFSDQVYSRGALTLHALRRLVGDTTFFEIVRTWTTEHRYGSASTADFIELSQRLSHRSLVPFFATWLDTPAKPEP